MRKRYHCLLVAMVLGLSAMMVQAVTVDLSSPQEGMTVSPGAAIQATATLTNDERKMDVIKLQVTISGDGISKTYSVMAKLVPGESLEQSVEFVIPAELEYFLSQPVEVTIKVVDKSEMPPIELCTQSHSRSPRGWPSSSN